MAMLNNQRVYMVGTSNQSVPEMAIDSFENGVPKNDEP